MTVKNKLLIYVAGFIAGYLYFWPLWFLAMFSFADFHGYIPKPLK